MKLPYHALIRQGFTEDCGQEELVQCTRPLQVLSATSELSFVTKKEELDKLCP
ncbi:AGAP011666-PA-like protein [Anopheles sinensis]|uniref:AGAP011666-PA-like protein n=1 Tax=Anopheles sinensis TaxID=74873 RepID=A0A084VID5_ANOSI|nr:AGAP011666-PA-like protein [Anopheles sinensis]